MGETLTTRHELPSGILTRAASFAPGSVDVEARTARVLWTTGAVRRTMTWEDGEVDEGLDLSGADLSAWDGAPVRDAHDIGSALDTLGVVEPGTTIRTADGLESTVRFARTDEGDKALALVADGIARQWSVGYDQVAYVRTDARARTDVKGATVPLYLARSWRPRELSLVPVGADPGARTRAAAGAFVTVEENIMSETAPVAPPVDVDAVRAAAVADFVARKAAIVQTAAVLGIQVDADAEAASQRSLDAFRAEAIAKRAAEQAKLNVSGVHLEVGVESVEKRSSAMVASLLHRAHPGNKKFAAHADARAYRGTLVEMLRDELTERGVSTRGMSAYEVAGRALRTRSGSSHTLTDLPNVFVEAISRSVAAGYEAASRDYLAFARQSNYRDFRTKHHIRLSGLPTPPRKVEGAPYERVKFSDARNTSTLETSAFRLDMTREMIVNDDLDILSQIAPATGDAFVHGENEIIFGLLNDNAALVDGELLFSAAHANILGSYGKPGATIAQALASRTWTTLEGKVRKFLYQHVMVPVEYTWEAEQYYLAPWAPVETAETRPRNAQGKTVSVSEYLPDGAWYVAAERSGLTFGYLEGAEGVMTETNELWDADVISVRARSDFAGGVEDHVGLVKIFETQP